MKLTAQQEIFCQQYVKCLSGNDAAIAAGYSKRSARYKASKLLTLPHIMARVKELHTEIAKRNNIDADAIVKELIKLGFYNVSDFIDDKNGIEKLKQMDRDKTAPVVGIKVTETSTGTGKRKKTTVTTEVKLADKKGALELLGRHLGIFEKDNKQKGQKITISRTK